MTTETNPGAKPDAKPAEEERGSLGGEPQTPEPVQLTPEQQAQQDRENEAKVEAAQAYKDDPRNAIFAKRREIARAETTESNELVQQAREEGRGLMDPEPPAPQPADTPVAPGGKTVKLVVYGQEREVPEAEVLQAGIATLQKDAAADQKLTAVARREQELRAQEQQLLLQAERVRQGLDPNTGLPLRTASQPPATGAEPAAISTDVLQSTVKALYSGDAEQATKALETLVKQIGARAGTANPVPTDIVATVEQTVLARMDQRDRERSVSSDIEQANQVFKTEFADIAADPDRLAAAKGIRENLLADPVWQSKSRVEVAREVGTRVRKLTTPAAPPPDPAVQTMEQRRSVKRGLPTTPQGGGRAPAPTAPTYPSNSSYIEQLRKNSGSNSAR